MLTLLFELYFSSILLIAGLAKLYNIPHFRATLKVSHIIPEQFISLASVFVPYFELAFALIILSATAPLIAAVLNLALFITFLAFKLSILLRKLPADCGCFGRAYKQKIDGVSITVSAVQVGLAAVYLALTIWTEPASPFIHWILCAALLGYAVLVLVRIRQRRKPQVVVRTT